MKKTALEIIDETVAYYSEDVSRRAIGNSITSCSYYTEDGRMCAVGRCLQKPENFKGNLQSAHSLNAEFGLEEIIKEEYKGHTLSFWESLQHLHDDNDHWTETGLNEHGLRKLENIKRNFC